MKSSFSYVLIHTLTYFKVLDWNLQIQRVCYNLVVLSIYQRFYVSYPQSMSMNRLFLEDESGIRCFILSSRIAVSVYYHNLLLPIKHEFS